MKKLVFLAVNLTAVVLAVVVLLQAMMGVTGFSDKMLGSVIDEEMRQMRFSLAQTIRDPDELEKVLGIRKQELIVLHGLDKPWYLRLPETTKRILTFNLGEAKTLRSFDGSSKVSDIIKDRFPNTLVLMLPAFLITFLFCLMVAPKLAAAMAGSKADRIITAASAVSFAAPAWWVGILSILLFGYYFGILPTGGMYSAPPPDSTFLRFLDVLKHAILPTMVLVAVMIGGYLYSIRSITLKTAREDFVKYARAQGLSEKRIVWRHILRPSAPPIITDFVFGLVSVISGAILTETVFQWPGMGLLYKEAILGIPDEGLIIALTFIYTLFYVAARLILEALYVWLDPRIRI